MTEIDWLIDLIQRIRRVRRQLRIPDSVRIPLLMADASEKERQLVDKYKEPIMRMANTEAPRFLEAGEKEPVCAVV